MGGAVYVTMGVFEFGGAYRHVCGNTRVKSVDWWDPRGNLFHVWVVQQGTCVRSGPLRAAAVSGEVRRAPET